MKRCMPMVVWPRAREVSKSVLGCGATGRIYGVGDWGFGLIGSISVSLA